MLVDVYLAICPINKEVAHQSCMLRIDDHECEVGSKFDGHCIISVSGQT